MLEEFLKLLQRFGVLIPRTSKWRVYLWTIPAFVLLFIKPHTSGICTVKAYPVTSILILAFLAVLAWEAAQVHKWLWVLLPLSILKFTADCL